MKKQSKISSKRLRLFLGKAGDSGVKFLSLTQHQSVSALAESEHVQYFDYPETEDEKIEALNEAYSNTLKLVMTTDNVIDYMTKKLNFPMDQFPFLLKHKESN